MTRALVIIALYAIAALAIYTGLDIAPDMTWPHTAQEWLAAQMVCLGMVAKVAGHFVLSGFIAR